MIDNTQNCRLLSCTNCYQAVAEGKPCCNRNGAPLPITVQGWGISLVEVLTVTSNHSVYRTEPRGVLKVMHGDVDPLHVNMARFSYGLVQSFQHRPGGMSLLPHVYRVSEPGSGLLRALIEYIPGPSLDQWIAAMRTKERVLQAGEAMLRYVRPLHAYNIVLTDLKGDNLKAILTPNGALDRVVYFDLDVLGVAFDRRDGDVLDSIRAGTKEYQSPEQVIGERIDCKADIFAIGRLLAKHLEGLASEAEIGAITGPLMHPRPELRPSAREALMHIRQFGGRRHLTTSRRFSAYATLTIAAITAALSTASYAGIQSRRDHGTTDKGEDAGSPTSSAVPPSSVNEPTETPERPTPQPSESAQKPPKQVPTPVPKPPWAAPTQGSKRKSSVNLDK